MSEIIKIDTKIRFAISVGETTKEDVFTLSDLGFSLDELSKKDVNKIKTEINDLYNDWKLNYLDGGWNIETEELTNQREKIRRMTSIF